MHDLINQIAFPTFYLNIFVILIFDPVRSLPYLFLVPVKAELF